MIAPSDVQLAITFRSFEPALPILISAFMGQDTIIKGTHKNIGIFHAKTRFFKVQYLYIANKFKGARLAPLIELNRLSEII